MVERDLPVKVGQLAESKSLIKGFRGAWFRCEIRFISRRDGDLYAFLEYYDYPDEKIKSIKLYQRIPSTGGAKTKKKQLMVRPCFPPIYRKSDKPSVGNISGLAIIAEDEWKVGDLVDWWTTGCFWSGRVTKILSNEMVQIELFPPPEGEGSTYDAHMKDLRPSLEWSPESGWTLPTIKVGHIRHCAQLIKPVCEGKPVDPTVAGEAQMNTGIGGSSSAPFHAQTQSRSSSADLELIPELASEGPQSTSNSKGTVAPSGPGVRKTRSSDTISGFGMQEDEEKDAATELEKLNCENTIRLNSMFSNTLEDAVLDLETLATRLRMFEDILKIGILPKTDQGSLKIPESLASTIPK